MSKQKSLYEAHITNDKRAFNKAEKRLLKRIGEINERLALHVKAEHPARLCKAVGATTEQQGAGKAAD